MRIVIMGRKNGKRIIRWPQLPAVYLMLVLLMGVIGAGTYRLISGEWKLGPVLILIPLVCGILGSGLGRSLKRPIEELESLD